MAKTKIEWADYTINPITGCSKCSPGCENCYAERFAARLIKNPKTAANYAGTIDEKGHWTGKLNDEGWGCLDTLPMYAPKQVFVGSMTDIFHENMDQRNFNELLGVFQYTWPRHTFMLLTKRPANAKKLIDAYKNDSAWAGQPIHEHGRLPKNVWLGVTVCTQEEAEAKIPALLEIPATLHFVSAEPLLERIDLSKWLLAKQLDWVIYGGETGPKARVMESEWACYLAGQCYGTKTPFFFKQVGGKEKEIPENLNIRQLPESPKI